MANAILNFHFDYLNTSLRIMVVNDANCLMRSQQLQGFYGGREHCKLSIAHNGGILKNKSHVP